MSTWREGNERVFDATVAAVAERLGIQPLAVEKDYWVCEALRGMEASYPDAIVFKGGTSLAKMGIISRFSEDLDLMVVGEVGNDKATKALLKGLCEAARAATRGTLGVGQWSGRPRTLDQPAANGKPATRGRPGTLGYTVGLQFPAHVSVPDGTAMADPDSILLELGQSTGHNPNTRRHVKSLLAQGLEDSAEVEIAAFEDLAGCSVRMLNPGRTLVEKLLRVNTFASLEPEERKDHYWPRIGRQYYDIWALLEVDEVREFLESPDIMDYVDDCIVQSARFGGDAPVPTGGFAASAAFNVNTDLARLLRAQHELAMRDLYYGPVTGRPTFDQTVERAIQCAALLDVAK